MSKRFDCFLLFCLSQIMLFSCQPGRNDGQVFQKRKGSSTGITFSNDIIENDSINILNYYYCYNGGGVAVGDFNNDKRQDVFFTGNMVSSRLYLNKGGLKFEDITTKSGVTTSDWIMGASVVDINNDGWLDIYLNVAGPGSKNHFKNLLFINQGPDEEGIPEFKESAESYGLADTSFSVQSAFFDYDRDGDLDMYLMTNKVDFIEKSFVHPKSYPLTKGLTNDKLYQNIGSPDSLGHPYYKDVSLAAGIKDEGYGLGLAIDDFNNDGWPDVYVANDFMPNDHLYINQKNGTFQESAAKCQKHQTYNGMGVDIADINNDLLPDVMVVDMLPGNNERRKSMMPGMSYEKFQLEQSAGYVPQFMRNTLNLNNGSDARGVHFSDIGQMAGVHATDWSWAPLMADFDNDGLRDIYITNGFVKDITDLDFINYQSSDMMFGSSKNRSQKRKDLMEHLKGVKLSNYLFKNKGNLSFSDQTEAWGLEESSFSNGSVYADLDNDGDLDIITNNINEEAFLFENLSNNNPEKKEENHFLDIVLKGEEKNKNGIGARIFLYDKDSHQYAFFSPVRGYLSSINAPLHFGLGNKMLIDSLEIFWSDGRYQKLKNIPTNQVLQLYYGKAQEKRTIAEKQERVFENITEELAIHYKHQENKFNDFYNNPLLLRQYSRSGPGIAVADVDHKNGLDFFVGGARDFPGTLFLQQADGRFKQKSINSEDAGFEDGGALFFDADNDGDEDLYVASDGSEQKDGNGAYQDRLYLNDGKGNFTRDLKALPYMQSSKSCVIGTDFDKDGDIDLFVGGRLQPGAYPESPRSYILRNDKGKFTDVTGMIAGDLSKIGMVSSALWTDFDNDGWKDLILVGEWMPVTFFRNEKGKFTNSSSSSGLQKSNGWYNSIYPSDLDNDGDIDYIVGNMGLNVDYKPVGNQSVEMFAYDYDNNGRIDPIVFHPILNRKKKYELFPFNGRDDLFKQWVALKKKFPDYASYGEADLSEIIPDDLLKKAAHFKADTFYSGILENKGSGKFVFKPLPAESQVSPVFGVVAGDFDEDENIDLITSGNSYATEVYYGWQDASLGQLLKGTGRGEFNAVRANQSGLFLDKDVKSLTSFMNKNGETILLAGSNSDSLVALKQRKKRQCRVIEVNPSDSFAEIVFKSGKKRKQEFYYGSGYLTQSPRSVIVTQNVKSLRVIDNKNKVRIYNF